MIDKINEILNNRTRKGKKIKLDYYSYKKLLKEISPISKKFVEMLVEQGCITSDSIKMKDEDMWGLRASLNFDYNDICNFYGISKLDDKFEDYEDIEFTYEIDKMNDVISKLGIRPKYILLNSNDIDFIFQPNQKISFKSQDDYINLVHSFIDYISQYKDEKINFIGWNLDNKEMIEVVPEKECNINFNRELFNQEISYVC